MGRTTDIANADARALIERGIDKAEQIAMRGSIVVIGATGALVSASRMDHGGAGGMARARSKAWIAATQQITSAEHLGRMRMIAPPMVSGFTALSPEAAFPGAGGMPIRRDGHVIAGIAASGAGIGPFVNYPGSQPELLIADGEPSNGEDLLVHYALDIPYVGQHGDDRERWLGAFGSFPESPGPGRGMEPAPAASAQDEHRWAVALADRLIALAVSRGERISVAIVDERGDPIQLDRMDGAPAASVSVAEAVAATAATFHCASEDLPSRYSGSGAIERLAALLPYPILPVAGGLPLRSHDGSVVGGLGIGGPPAAAAGDLAAAGVEAAGLAL